jgi:sugar phosphate isomerase/epimerase
MADPLEQAGCWAEHFFHIHGKDARVDHPLIARQGLYGAARWSASCFPGNGETDWRVLIEILRNSGYQGTIDSEGWNDAEWSGDRELQGQSRAMKYLKSCR